MTENAQTDILCDMPQKVIVNTRVYHKEMGFGTVMPEPSSSQMAAFSKEKPDVINPSGWSYIRWDKTGYCQWAHIDDIEIICSCSCFAKTIK